MIPITGRNIVYLGVGAAVGGVIGYLIAEEIVYRRLEKEFAENAEELINDENSVANISRKDLEEAEWVNYSEMYPKEEKEKLEELTKKYQSELEEPHVISIQEWGDPRASYERTTILYYAGDHVFAEMNGKEISAETIADILVPNPHLHFGEGSEDDDVVYYSNPHEEMMYELVRQHGSYEQEVLGKPPKPKPPTRQRRAKPPKDDETDD